MSALTKNAPSGSFVGVLGTQYDGPSVEQHYGRDRKAYEAALTEICALFGVDRSDASAIERQWRMFPEQRRADSLTRHTALTLRARKRFLSGGRKAVSA